MGVSRHWWGGEGSGRTTLVATGRRTGRTREVPLYAFEDGDRLVVIGSNAGGAREPAWVGNLRARPRAQVRIRRELRAVVAFEAAGEERERLWALVVEGYPGCALYAQRATRRIPVVVLEAARDAWPTPLPRRAVAGASIARSPTGSGYGVAVGAPSSL